MLHLTSLSAVLALVAVLPSATAEPLSLPIVQHDTRQHSPLLSDREAWAFDQAIGLRAKYLHLLTESDRQIHRQAIVERDMHLRSRAVGNVSLTNVGVDGSFSAVVSLGTPAQNLLLILDTGSTDTWVAGTACAVSTCGNSTRFDSAQSSSFQGSSQAFSIQYGIGSARGVSVQDTVSLGGFTVNSQGFAVVNDTSASLLTSPISGLMGFAWDTLSQTGSTPFWQTLAAGGAWSSQEMAFYLKRYRGSSGVQRVETDGGEFIMGGTNPARYTGSINYISVPNSSRDYWRLPVQGMTMQGNAVNISTPQAAIDTGTTLIGVPSSTAALIYAQIPGASAITTSSGRGYWQYPCNTTVSMTLQFGGLSYAVSNADFNMGIFSAQNPSLCRGAVFELNVETGARVSWVVGATFLKNVYSVYRYNPPAIGFAALAGSNSSVTQGTAANTTSSGTPSSTGRSGALSVVAALGYPMVVCWISVIVLVLGHL